MAKKVAEYDQFQVRFPEGMRDRLKVAADKSGRSMNAEIILRLQNALDRQEDGTISVWLPSDLLDRVYETARREEIDPNLLILDAVERAFPPRPSLPERLREIAQDLDAWDDRIISSRDDLLKLIAEIIEDEDDEARAMRWKKRGDR